MHRFSIGLIQIVENGKVFKNVILLLKLFRPIVRKKYSSDREKRLKFKAEDQEFANILEMPIFP